MREAWLYEKLENGRVRCHLCAHRCLIGEGKVGLCFVRENQGGTLYTLTYGQLLAQHVDPIEKKPLFHFYPGSAAFSIATAGCNFRCSFCQNADISQVSREQGYVPGRDTAPEAIVNAAQRAGCRSIAYTYTEPTMFFEYSYEIGQLAHGQGLANVYVSNGFMSPEMLDMTTSPIQPPLIDAANIDLKAFREAFYRHECGGALQPVLDSLITMKKRGVWLEVTTLVIPQKNDTDEELRDIARFIATELGVDTPWHVSRFHPTYKLTDRGVTPVRTLQRAREIGLEAGLRYVYEGNVPGDGEDTYCPQCGRKVIDRIGFAVLRHDAQGGVCKHCGTPIAGIGL